MDIYDYEDYKKFVDASLATMNKKGATRRDLAFFIGCQPSHVTAVLGGDAHFSSEQADKTAQYLKLERDQTAYFLILVQFNRAGTESLRGVYSTMLSSMKASATPIRNKLGINEDLSDEVKAQYYSSWIYSCVHVMLSIEAFQSSSAISDHLGIPQTTVENILRFLVGAGLAVKKDPGKYIQQRSMLHLDNASPFLIQHHSNWRLRAVQEISQAKIGQLHYSGVVSLSKKDSLRIKEILSEALKAAINVVRESPEEQISCINIDFFDL